MKCEYCKEEVEGLGKHDCPGGERPSNSALSAGAMRKPVLCAFKVEGQEGTYNVWRYDTPSTQCVLFAFKADSPEIAKAEALKKISAQQG